MPQFTIEFTEETMESLTFLRKHEQVAVLDAIEVQLASEPVAETRNRNRPVPREDYRFRKSAPSLVWIVNDRYFGRSPGRRATGNSKSSFYKQT